MSVLEGELCGLGDETEIRSACLCGIIFFTYEHEQIPMKAYNNTWRKLSISIPINLYGSCSLVHHNLCWAFSSGLITKPVI